jgi:hypothetical protein
MALENGAMINAWTDCILDKESLGKLEALHPLNYRCHSKGLIYLREFSVWSPNCSWSNWKYLNPLNQLCPLAPLFYNKLAGSTPIDIQQRDARSWAISPM